MDAYEAAQQLELQWWISYPYDPPCDWEWYDKFFGFEYTKLSLGNPIIADVGSGPTPYSAHLFPNQPIICIDSLGKQYAQLDKYARYQQSVEHWLEDTGICADDTFDVIVCTNMLDHVAEPSHILNELLRICKPHGLLFFMCDVDKPTDPMHIHSLNGKWLLQELIRLFEPIASLRMPSWKFKNDVLFFVGKKRDVDI